MQQGGVPGWVPAIATRQAAVPTGPRALKDALSIFRFLRDAHRRGERTVLITLIRVTGSGVRSPGSHMAVGENGISAGSFSGGCIEAAVVAEALQALDAGQPRTVRFGAGSPYIDIRLPCGGGIDLLFNPDPCPDAVERAVATLELRHPIAASVSEASGLRVGSAGEETVTRWAAETFVARHDPALRIIAVGQGSEPGALLRIARAFGADTVLLTPDAPVAMAARADGHAAWQLYHHGRSDALVADRWTAVIFLFHDHDWETDLLLQALETPALLIGAMGSRRTHAERSRRLAERRASAAQIGRIAGPVGLIGAARDPDTLAISIMAQIVAAYDEKFGGGKVANVTERVDDAAKPVVGEL